MGHGAYTMFPSTQQKQAISTKACTGGTYNKLKTRVLVNLGWGSRICLRGTQVALDLTFLFWKWLPL